MIKKFAEQGFVRRVLARVSANSDSELKVQFLSLWLKNEVFHDSLHMHKPMVR